MTAPELGMAAWPAAMFVWGPGFISTPHRHPCMQLTMTLGGTLEELMAGDITCLNPRLVSRWRAALGSPMRGTRVDQWVRNDLLNGGPPVTMDGRVRRVLTYVRQ